MLLQMIDAIEGRGAIEIRSRSDRSQIKMPMMMTMTMTTLSPALHTAKYYVYVLCDRAYINCKSINKKEAGEGLTQKS